MPTPNACASERRIDFADLLPCFGRLRVAEGSRSILGRWPMATPDRFSEGS